jgi:hypothetical protein
VKVRYESLCSTAIVEVDDLVGVAHEGAHVGGHEVGAPAHPQHDRAAVAGHDDAAGLAVVDHGQAVGADHHRQRLAHGVLEQHVAGAQAHELRDHLGVGVGGHLHAVGQELGPQLGGVLDDAVVRHGQVAGGVDMGMGVGVGGLAVGGPTGVADADRALQPLGQRRDQLVDPPGPLVHLQARRAHDGDARRVVAPVLQALEALDQHRHGVTVADISDDPAHDDLLAVDDPAELPAGQGRRRHRAGGQLGRDAVEDGRVGQAGRLQLAVAPAHQRLDRLAEVGDDVVDHAPGRPGRQVRGAHQVVDEVGMVAAVLHGGDLGVGGRRTQRSCPNPGRIVPNRRVVRPTGTTRGR